MLGQAKSIPRLVQLFGRHILETSWNDLPVSPPASCAHSLCVRVVNPQWPTPFPWLSSGFRTSHVNCERLINIALVPCPVRSSDPRAQVRCDGQIREGFRRGALSNTCIAKISYSVGSSMRMSFHTFTQVLALPGCLDCNRTKLAKLAQKIGVAKVEFVWAQAMDIQW